MEFGSGDQYRYDNDNDDDDSDSYDDTDEPVKCRYDDDESDDDNEGDNVEPVQAGVPDGPRRHPGDCQLPARVPGVPESRHSQGVGEPGHQGPPAGAAMGPGEDRPLWRRPGQSHGVW